MDDRQRSDLEPPASRIAATEPSPDEPPAAIYASHVVRMIPTMATFALAYLVTWLVPGVGFQHQVAAVAAAAVLALAVAIGAFTRVSVDSNWGAIVPILATLAVGVAVVGVGPIMLPILFIPTAWLGTFRGRQWGPLAGVVSAVAIAIQFFWPNGTQLTTEAVVGVCLLPLVVAGIAVVTNSVTADNVQRLEHLQVLNAERDAALEQASEVVEQLRDNEAQLNTATALFRSVLDSVTQQSVIGTDLRGLIDVWNPGAETMFGLPAREISGWRHIHEFHVADELEERAKELGYPAGATVLNPGFSALVEVARLGGAEDRDWTYVRSNGDQFPVHVAVTPRLDEVGRTVGYIFVGTDITERKELARMQDEFVGLVSHELRTPVSSILGYLELMRDHSDPALTEEQLQYLSVAERNAHRLLRLVGDLLFTAQVAAHKFPIDTADISVNAVVTAAVESARPSSQRANVLLLSKIVEEGDPIVTADSTRIAQAVDNLLSNAIKFTPRGGTVTVSVEVVNATVRIAVRDTGMGIPPDEIEHLSERFFRASTATRNAVQGVGLGLSITKAIVTAHGGELSAQSTVGVGTTFAFTIPLLRLDAGAATAR